jgi:formate transporter FocA
MTNETVRVDGLSPVEMAQKATSIGIKKSNLPARQIIMLAMLAGAYIGLGGVFSTVVTTGAADLPYGVAKFLSGLAFSVGLIFVIIGGAELFTGNTLLSIAFASRKISWKALLRNWAIVYVGNFIGATLLALFVFLSHEYTQASGAWGSNALNIGNVKTGLSFVPALFSGILCNMLVCLAVWMTYSCHTVAEKILAIIPPIATFVAAGFEHSVANMYFISLALMIKKWGGTAFFDSIGKSAADFSNLTLKNFFIANLLPVTIGNIIGGAVIIGLTYWWIYLKSES